MSRAVINCHPVFLASLLPLDYNFHHSVFLIYWPATPLCLGIERCGSWGEIGAYFQQRTSYLMIREPFVAGWILAVTGPTSSWNKGECTKVPAALQTGQSFCLLILVPARDSESLAAPTTDLELKWFCTLSESVTMYQRRSQLGPHLNPMSAAVLAKTQCWILTAKGMRWKTAPPPLFSFLVDPNVSRTPERVS